MLNYKFKEDTVTGFVDVFINQSTEQVKKTTFQTKGSANEFLLQEKKLQMKKYLVSILEYARKAQDEHRLYKTMRKEGTIERIEWITKQIDQYKWLDACTLIFFMEIDMNRLLPSTLNLDYLKMNDLITDVMVFCKKELDNS
jgi:hypothetical protein